MWIELADLGLFKGALLTFIDLVKHSLSPTRAHRETLLVSSPRVFNQRLYLPEVRLVPRSLSLIPARLGRRFFLFKDTLLGLLFLLFNFLSSSPRCGNDLINLIICIGATQRFMEGFPLTSFCSYDCLLLLLLYLFCTSPCG